MKILYKGFSGLAGLSQIIWTPESLLLLVHFDMAMMSFLSEHLLWVLDFCPTHRAELLEDILWPGRSLTINRGDSAKFSWVQWIFPQLLQISMCKLVLNPSFPLGIPQSWDGTTGKSAEKSHQDVQCLFPEESRTLQRNAGGFQMSGQNAGGVWRENWANIDSSVSQHWNPAGVWSCLFRARQKWFL